MDWRQGDAGSSLVGYERPLPDSEPFRALVASREPYVVADRAELDPTSLAFSALEALGAKSLVGIPIHREGELIGVLGMSWPEPRAFPPDEIVFFGRGGRPARPRDSARRASTATCRTSSRPWPSSSAAASSRTATGAASRRCSCTT